MVLENIMANTIDWIVIDVYPGKPIGAIGFIENKAAVIAAFYDAYDTNRDGKVSWGEWGVSWIPGLNVADYEIATVAMTARVNSSVLRRDGTFHQLANDIYLNFATGLVKEGLYKSYLSRSVGSIGTSVAGRLTENLVKRYLIKKGMESAVKKAYQAFVG